MNLIQRARYLPRRNKLAIIVGVVLILLIGAIVYVFATRQTSCEINYTLACAIDEAAPLLDKSDYVNLAPVVTRIQGIKDYQFSPDLNVIVLEYSLGVGDATFAQKHYELLKNSFDEDVGYNEKLLRAKTPEEYKPRIDFVKVQIDEARKNLFGVPKDER